MQLCSACVYLLLLQLLWCDPLALAAFAHDDSVEWLLSLCQQHLMCVCVCGCGCITAYCDTSVVALLRHTLHTASNAGTHAGERSAAECEKSSSRRVSTFPAHPAASIAAAGWTACANRSLTGDHSLCTTLHMLAVQCKRVSALSSDATAHMQHRCVCVTHDCS